MTRNFYNLPPSWNPGFAIPDYVMAEPPGRGTFTTAWLPRGTISAMVPDFSAVKLGQKIWGRTDAGLGSLGDDTLGAAASVRTGGKNPIAEYGDKAASWIMHSIKSVPSDRRTATLRALFDAIDTALWGKVEARATQLRGQGLPASQALQQAMATSMAEGMLAEMVAAGKRAQRGQRPAAQGQLALGLYPEARDRATVYALEALGFSLSDLNPLKYVAKGAAAVGGAIKTGVSAVGSGIKTGALAVGGAVSSAAGAVGSFVQNGVKMLGGLACSVASSSAGQLAATAAAGPIGAAGAAATAGSCGGASAGQIPTTTMLPPPPARPAWVMPVAIGAGVVGVGAILYLATR